MNIPSHPAWHALTPDAALDALESRRDGLSSAEAEHRLALCGPNILPTTRPRSAAILFLAQFRSPLIYILLAAALLSLGLGDNRDAGVILVILIANALLGAFQEARADAAARALEKLVHVSARVRRAGTVLDLDAREVVPGDVVLLESGGAAPADLRLLETTALLVDESLLTGEALPVDKQADAAMAADAVIADRATMAHAGTHVLKGRAVGVAVATGADTALGHIAASLNAASAPPPLLGYLSRLARQIAVGTAILILFLALALVVRGGSVVDVLLLAIALAVSAIPEGLPIAVTVALATATRRMAERNVVVRALPSVEGLGSCTLIAADKTGTLTLNRLTVEMAILPGGRRANRPAWANGADRDELLVLAATAAACNEAILLGDGSGVGDSLDIALLRFAQDLGVAPPAAERVITVHPYEPVNRFSSVAIRETDGRGTIHAKGAAERIIAMCGDPDPALIASAEACAADGYRVIALARSEPDLADGSPLSDPRGLRLVGLLGLLDPLRPEVPDAVARCRAAGIEVRMITGDHPATAATIARSLGLAASEAEILTGRELAALEADPERRDARILAARVFARTEPAQKLLIVETLGRAGHVVAVTGDGANDAPALEAAAIGVAMARSGTDVARAAADLLLIDDNFASIVAGVEEGRICYGNIRKIVIFLLATGIAEIVMFLGAVLLGLPAPLSALQLLWANIVSEGVQNAALGLGRGDGDELAQPPRPSGSRLLDGDAMLRIIPPASIMAAVALWQFGHLLDRGASLEAARSDTLLAVVLFQNLFMLSVRNLRRPLWADIRRDGWLFAGIGAALALHALALCWPPLQKLLGMHLPDTQAIGVALLGAGATLAVAELVKAILARRSKPIGGTLV